MNFSLKYLERSTGPIKKLEKRRKSPSSLNTSQFLSMRCFIMVDPSVLSLLAGVTTSSVLQFGGRPESRQEFSSAPGHFADKSEFAVEFKTSAGDGIILYVDDQAANPVDFLALYVKNGFLVYAFNPGKGPAVARTTQK